MPCRKQFTPEHARDSHVARRFRLATRRLALRLSDVVISEPARSRHTPDAWANFEAARPSERRLCHDNGDIIPPRRTRRERFELTGTSMNNPIRADRHSGTAHNDLEDITSVPAPAGFDVN